MIEWAARLVLSYSFTPCSTIDLTDPVDVRRAGAHPPRPRRPLAAAEPSFETSSESRQLTPPTSASDPPEENTSCPPTSSSSAATDVDDLEAILSIVNTDRDEAIHAVTDNAEAIFTWDYEKGARPALNKLYEKAKGAQWNGETDLPWDTDVDIEAVVVNNFIQNEGDGVGFADFDVVGHAVREVDRRSSGSSSASSRTTGR